MLYANAVAAYSLTRAHDDGPAERRARDLADFVRVCDQAASAACAALFASLWVRFAHLSRYLRVIVARALQIVSPWCAAREEIDALRVSALESGQQQVARQCRICETSPVNGSRMVFRGARGGVQGRTEALARTTAPPVAALTWPARQHFNV